MRPQSSISAVADGGADGKATLAQKVVNWNNRPRSRTGSGRSHGVVLAMRYVIVIAAVTFFLFWDGLYNHGYYLDATVREVSRIVRYVTG